MRRDIDWNMKVPDGYYLDERGEVRRLDLVSERRQQENLVVEKIHGYAKDLSLQIARFRMYTFKDILEFVDAIVNEYGGKAGGKHGNITLRSLNGCMKVQLVRAMVIEVGPEIEAARNLIDECMADWGKNANKNLRAMVETTFSTTDGKISVTDLLRLRRVEFDDPRWPAVKKALSDALRVLGRKEYIRIYVRDNPGQPWRQLSLNMATVQDPEDYTEETAEAVLYRRITGAVTHAKTDGLSAAQIRKVTVAARQGKPLDSNDESAKAEGGGND